jgi:dsRNA-specific ribonuclease
MSKFIKSLTPGHNQMNEKDNKFNARQCMMNSNTNNSMDFIKPKRITLTYVFDIVRYFVPEVLENTKYADPNHNAESLSEKSTCATSANSVIECENIFRKRKELATGVKLDIFARAFNNGSLQMINPNVKTNENLEFLGDSVLHSVLTHYLCERYSNEDDGFLTYMRIRLERRDTCAELTKALQIHYFIQKTPETLLTEDMLEDVFEAFIGAFYLSFGFTTTKKFLINLYEQVKDITESLTNNDNYKDLLLKYYHQKKWGHPEYEGGKRADGKFERYVRIPTTNEIIGKGFSINKKQAEQNSSKNALIYLGVIVHGKIDPEWLGKLLSTIETSEFVGKAKKEIEGKKRKSSAKPHDETLPEPDNSSDESNESNESNDEQTMAQQMKNQSKNQSNDETKDEATGAKLNASGDEHGSQYNKSNKLFEKQDILNILQKYDPNIRQTSIQKKSIDIFTEAMTHKSYVKHKDSKPYPGSKKTKKDETSNEEQNNQSNEEQNAQLNEEQNAQLNEALSDELSERSLMINPKIVQNNKSKRITKDNTHKIVALQPRSNDKIRFIGNAIFHLVLADMLYTRYNDKQDEGFMTQVRSKLENLETKFELANKLQLDQYVLISQFVEKTHQRTNMSIISKAFEGFIGALYLVIGYGYTRDFVTSLIDKEIGLDNVIENETNYKAILLQIYNKNQWSHPVYQIVNEEGPDHNKIFTVTVDLFGRVIGKGKGSSKKKAEQFASKKACEILEKQGYTLN